MLKKLWRKWGPNPLDRLLKKKPRTVLIVWNRGMGDIALGLFAIVHRIHTLSPGAAITFITRPDLEEPFRLLANVHVRVDPAMKRGSPYTLPASLPPFDLIIERADPTHWVAWQRGSLTPRLTWNGEWDRLHHRFQLPQGCVAAHVSCETNYYFERNWPHAAWQKLFHAVQQPIVLFGLKKEPLFEGSHIVDLRGETSILEALSIIKNCSSTLIAPDSGVLSLSYFLDAPFPLRVVSLWADPNHGVLKQNVPSPNPYLSHRPVISPDKKRAALIVPEAVLAALC